MSTKEDKAIAIQVSSLSKKFGDFTAVDSLNMTIESGRIHGFLGPNGSGKTTAIRMMCGLMKKTQGTINVLGLSIPEQTEAIRSQVGYMTQRFSLYEDMTITENLHFLSEIRGITYKNRIEKILIEYNLYEFRNRLAGTLSGGQKRRLALAGAVITQPKLLILDEPTSEVDPNTRHDIWSKLFNLAAKGTSILVSTHLMDEAERCHNLTILNNGKKVVDGKTEILKSQFPHSICIIKGHEVASLTDSLYQKNNIISASQSGIILRVIVNHKENRPIDYLKNLVGQSYQVTQSQPTIEDIFVASTQTNDH